MAISLRSDVNSTNQNNATEHDFINLFMEKLESPFKSAFHYFQAVDHFTSGHSLKSLLSKTLLQHGIWKYSAFGGITLGGLALLSLKSSVGKVLGLGALFLISACKIDFGIKANTNDTASDCTHEETCNGIDDNCDGEVDEGVKVVYNKDEDEDNFGNNETTTEACSVPKGYAEMGDDCDDGNAEIHPEAEEVPYDSVDQDCDGSDLTDVDGDGYKAEEVGGEDCDDSDEEIHVGAEEIKGNEEDENCNGYKDELTVECDDSSYRDIQKGIDAALESGDDQIVYICSGTYSGFDFEITSGSLTLVGEDFESVKVNSPIDMELYNPVLIRSMSFQNAPMSIYAIDTSLDIEASVFTDCEDDPPIYFFGTYLTENLNISGSSFHSNLLRDRCCTGGAMHFTGNELNITETEFYQNDNENVYGTVITVYGGIMTIEDSTLYDNGYYYEDATSAVVGFSCYRDDWDYKLKSINTIWDESNEGYDVRMDETYYMVDDDGTDSFTCD